jgi:hypothetical protein
MPAESGDRNAVLSVRRNVVVIADEAHRSQYDFIVGFSRHMRDALPQASLARTVEDGATVPIYYEGRLAKLELSEAERPKIDRSIQSANQRTWSGVSRTGAWRSSAASWCGHTIRTPSTSCVNQPRSTSSRMHTKGVTRTGDTTIATAAASRLA